MNALINDPVADFNEHLPEISKRFDFARPPIIVGRSEPDKEEDAEIYDGIAVTSFGYFRVARHLPTNAFCLIASKSPTNLRGRRDAPDSPDNPDTPIMATTEGLAKSYIVAAFRAPEGGESYTVANRLRRAMHRHGDSISERSEKHFTLYGANLTNPNGDSKVFNTDTPTEVWTNGRLAYLLDQTAKGEWRVSFYAPTKRKDGSFVPVTLGKSKLADKFARVSRVISKASSYERAREDMAEHWQKISSRLWDEQSIYKGEGAIMRASSWVSNFCNELAENGPRLAFVTASVGATLGAFNPKLGIIGGVAAAIVHTVMDHIADESYVTSRDAIKRSRDAKRRLDIDSYPAHGDVSDHFKIQTPGNIAKLSAKLDLERFSAEEFEFLDSNSSGLLRDHEFATEGFRPDSIKDHVLSMHQRGFSSSCYLPDKKTRLDLFQSGLVRLMHEMPDGNVRFYAGYREDACTEERLRLPKELIERLKYGIIAIDYERKNADFNQAFQSHMVTTDDMLDEMTPLLFRDQKDVPEAVRSQSIRSICDVFSGCVGERIKLRGKKNHTPSLPDLRAIL